MRSRIFAHGVIQIAIHDEVVEVLGDSFVITSFDQEPALAVLDLKRDTARKRCNDGFALP